MKCYVCEQTVHLGGVRYGVAEAVGICHHCGVAVCIDHSHKAGEPGAPLLCLTCAEIYPPRLLTVPDQALDRRKA